MEATCPSLFVHGELRRPRCHRKRPMEELTGIYDSASDCFTVKGIRCEACGKATGVGPTRWGSWFPTPASIPTEVKEPICPFCRKVLIPAPGRDAMYMKCTDSPLVYRLVVG